MITLMPMNRTNRNNASGSTLITKARAMQHTSIAGHGITAMARTVRRQASTMSRARSSSVAPKLR